MSDTPKKFAFILGRERDLCLAELQVTLDRFGFCFSDFIVSDNIVFINLDNAPVPMPDLLKVLGGTVKIFEIINPMFDKIKPVLENYIISNQKKEGKFNFALSSFTNKFDQRRINSLGLEIKKDLKGKFSTRFVELREGKEVSTILSLKSKLVDEGFEFGLFNESVGILVATTDPVEWSERDYEKPAGDKRSGMLPPKLARIMLNLCLGNDSSKTCVIDPFCGSGNVVLEAMMLGLDVFASDISEKAVRDTKENVEWLKSNLQSNSNYQIPRIEVEHCDATSEELVNNLKSSINNYDSVAVVAEPYLGEPKKFKPSLNAARGEYAKIKELYINFFKNFAALGSEAVFCLVFPLVETIEGEYFSLFDESVDEITKIGYSVLVKPLVYGRDYQVVKRQIVLLTLTK